MLLQVAPTINLIIDVVLQKTNAQIEQIEMQRMLPLFLHSEMSTKIQLQFQSMSHEPEPNNYDGLHQQQMYHVPHLQKDTLMPRGIQRQSQQIDKVQNLSKSKNKKKKGLNNTKSSFNRSNINSLGNQTGASRMTSFSKKKKAKKDETQLRSIQNGQNQQDEIKSLRKIYDIQLQALEKEETINKEKEKIFSQKKEHFNNQLVNRNYTFDFQGDPIPNFAEQQQARINHYSMKMRLGFIDRKQKSDLKVLDNDNVQQIKFQKKPTFSSQNPSFSIDFCTIPVFQNENNIDPTSLFGMPEVGRYKLKEYKKYYGGKFARIDRSSHTMQLTNDKNDQYSQIFAEKKFLKDEQKNMNSSMVSYRSRIQQATKRKLALPKIHGKYSTLDRYQSF